MDHVFSARCRSVRYQLNYRTKYGCEDVTGFPFGIMLHIEPFGCDMIYSLVALFTNPCRIEVMDDMFL